MTQSEPNALAQIAEPHRPVVRETNNAMANVYGFGGGAVLLAAGAVLAIGWTTSLLGWVASIVVAVTVGLVGLFVLRMVVNRRREALRERFESYCEINDVSPDTLRDYYREEDIYPFFVALYETPAREA